LDEAGEELLPVPTHSQSAIYADRPTVRVGEGILGQVAQTGQSATVANVQTDPRYPFREMAQELGLVSLLSVPLTVRDKVIGVLNCYTAETHPFSSKEEVFLQTLANQTALAIENARLVASAAIVREMHHRVKNNLQTIAMLLRVQMSSRPKLPADDVLPEAINRILAIAAVHETLSESGWRSVNIKEVLTQIADTVVQNLSHPDKALHVTVIGDEIVLPSQSATALALATNELLQNALEHAFVGCDAGTVQVMLREEDETLTISVIDDGVGLAGGMDALGASLGLEIVQTLVVEDLQGSFTLTPSESGTKAVICLPRTGA
jgi:two-component sensor histidine kinase